MDYFYTSENTFFDHLNSNTYVIGVGSIQEITTDYSLFINLLKLSYFCIGGKSMNEILSYMEIESIDSKYLDKMFEKRFLINKEINYDDRYSRNKLYYNVLGYNYEEIQKTISNSHVLVIGAGGIGNIVSYTLASIGVRKITIIDDDIIEETNLNRQFLFREEDINKEKVSVIKREIMKINKDISLDVFSSKLSLEIINKILDVDLIISSADDEYCIDLLNEFCVRSKIPLICVGYLNDISIIGPFYLPYLRSSCCLACDKSIYLKNDIFDIRKEEIKHRKKAPSVVVNNFFSGAMLSSELIKFFAKDYENLVSLNNVVGIYNSDFHLDKIEVKRNKACIICGG